MDTVKGTAWAYNTIMTSGTMGWEHGTLSFDNNGLGHMSGIVRNGSSLADRGNIPYTMSLSGMLLYPGGNTTFSQMLGSGGPFSSSRMTFTMNGGEMTMGDTGGGTGGGMMGGGLVTSTFHGITNGGRNIMVSTHSDGTGGYPFSIQVK
jgi:hypothetical protein